MRDSNRWVAVVAGLACVVLLAGCLGPRDVLETRLYRLNPAAPVSAPEAPSGGPTLGLRPLDAAQPYDLRMAAMGPDRVVTYRAFDKWAEFPSDVLTRTLADALVATGRFADVGNAADMSRPDLILTGEIRAFHENRAVSPPVAEVEARFEMREARAPVAVWSGTLHETAPMNGQDGAAFANAMNIAVGRLMEKAAGAMAEACQSMTAATK